MLLMKLHHKGVCWRHLEASVHSCDFGLSSMSTEGESALVRFPFRKAPSLALADGADHPTTPPAMLLPVLLAYNPWGIHLQDFFRCMHTVLEAMSTNIVQVTTAPSSPPQHDHIPCLLSNLPKLTSPLHSTWHHSWMYCPQRVPSTSESLLVPTAPRPNIAQDVYQHIFDRGCPLAGRTNQPFPLCQQWYLHTRSCRCCSFGHVS
jgi:hypothetical protein